MARPDRYAYHPTPNILPNWKLALDTPLHTALSLQVAAVFKGLGGGFAILNSVHSALVADTSSMSVRSFHMGLLWIMYWIGAAVSPLVSAYFMERNLYGQNFALAVATWAVYLLYARFMLPETFHVVTDEDSSNIRVDKGPSAWPEVRVFLRDMWEPMPLIFGHSILRWLGFVSAATLLGAGAFLLQVPYFDGKFGLSPKEVRFSCQVIWTRLLRDSDNVIGCCNQRGRLHIQGFHCLMRPATLHRAVSPICLWTTRAKLYFCARPRGR